MMEYVVGTITGANDTVTYLKGVQTQSRSITVENICQSISDPKYKDKPIVQLTLVDQGVKPKAIIFPLKVDGFTFKNAEQFITFTSDSCSCCGDIPNLNDNRNTQMYVYPKEGKIAFDLDVSEFICGKCIIEDSKSNSNK
jgi:hypothetical protein